jgi:hypothetical protein
VPPVATFFFAAARVSHAAAAAFGGAADGQVAVAFSLDRLQLSHKMPLVLL